jgi:hypothetical protein
MLQNADRADPAAVPVHALAGRRPLVLLDETAGPAWVELSAALQARGFRVCSPLEQEAQSDGDADVVRIIDAAALADPPAHPFLVVAPIDLVLDLATVLAAGASGYFIAPVNLMSLAAAICVASRELRSNADLAQRSDKLALAADENRTVGMVVGMLMERYHVPRDAAYARLRSYSRMQRLRISEVATRMLASTDEHFRLSHGIWAAALSGAGAAQPSGTTER